MQEQLQFCLRTQMEAFDRLAVRAAHQGRTAACGAALQRQQCCPGTLAPPSPQAPSAGAPPQGGMLGYALQPGLLHALQLAKGQGLLHGLGPVPAASTAILQPQN